MPLVSKDEGTRLIMMDGQKSKQSFGSPVINPPVAIEKTDIGVNSDSMKKISLDSFKSETKVIIDQPVADKKSDDIEKPPRKIDETIALKVLRPKPKDEDNPTEGMFCKSPSKPNFKKKFFRSSILGYVYSHQQYRAGNYIVHRNYASR